MDSKLIEDQHIVARYLADQLSEAEREAFEAYCAEHPQMFRELEAAARLKGGLARLEESGQLGAGIEQRMGFGAFAWRHAASLAAIGVGIAVLLAGVYSLRVPAIGASVAEVSGRFRSALPLAGEYEIVRMRDSETVDLTIKLPASPSAIQLRVLPDEEGASLYSATLSREGENGVRRIARAENLTPDDKHFVSFFVSSGSLVPGTYLLSLSPEGSTGGGQPDFRIAVER